MKNKRSKDIFWMILSILISLVGVSIVYQLWNKDIKVPVVYHGDGVGAIFATNNIINGKEFWKYENMSAPYGDMYFFHDYFVAILIMKFLALFVDNAAVAINAYWLFTYVLTAVTMYILMRKMKISPEIAMVGAVTYNFLPYHYFRLQHFWLMGCYLIPLAVWLIVDLLDEELFGRESSCGLIGFIRSRKFGLDVFFCLLLGFGGVYYAVFTIVIMGIVAVYRAVECKKISYIFVMMMNTVLIALPVVCCYLIPSTKLNHSLVSMNAATRNITQLNTYGLKLALLLFPIPGHRLSFLNDFTKSYFESMGVGTEADIVQLGFLMSLGLIISIASIFCTKIWGKRQKEIVQIGQINIIIILVSVVGGLDIFIGLFVSSTIRCYNRMVVFIAVFSIACICILLNQICEMGRIKWYLKYCIAFAVVIFGIWDQTSPLYANYENYNLRIHDYEHPYSEKEMEYNNNNQFVNDSVKQLDNERMMYLMPCDSAYNVDRVPFDKKKACIVSYETNWSFYLANIEYKNWMKALENYETEVFLNALSVLGFSGIIIDKNSYATDQEFERVIGGLEDITGISPQIDVSGLLYFYNISSYKETFLSQYEEKDRKRLKNGITASMYIKCNSLIGKDIQISNGNLNQKLSRKVQIPKGVVQFGPYINLSKGKYGVMINGTNLDDAAIWVTVDSGQTEIPLIEVQRSPDAIIYEFELMSDSENIEFLMCNNIEDMVINEYCYFECKAEEYFDIYKEYLADIMYFQKEIEYGHIYSSIPLSEFWMGDIQCKYSESKIFIEKGVLQYGPYITLEAGKYRVIVQGEGLQKAEPKVTYNTGNEIVEINEIGRKGSYLIYEFDLETTVKGVEFLLINNSRDMMLTEYGYETSNEGFFSKSEELLLDGND